MKQRILFVFAICLFLLTGFWHTVIAIGENPTISNEPTPEKIQYALPYPGVLPDHPLYFIKRVRDYILERLIVEPVRKGEFYILQGDKRLEMGIMLLASGKSVLAETTISKAEKYMEQAVMTLLSYQKDGNTIPTYIADKVRLALSKHQEVLLDMVNNAPEAQKNGLQESLSRVKLLLESAKELK